MNNKNHNIENENIEILYERFFFIVSNLFFLYFCFFELDWFSLDVANCISYIKMYGFGGLLRETIANGRHFPVPFITCGVTEILFHDIGVGVQYVFHYIAFIFVEIIVYIFLKLLNISSGLRVAAIISLYLSTTFVESVLTIGKAEVLMMDFILIALFLFYLQINNIIKNLVIENIIIMLLILIGHFTKETSAIIIVPTILMVLYSCFIRNDIKKKAICFAISVTASFVIMYIIIAYMPNSDLTYTQGAFAFDNFAKGVLIYLRYCPDVFFVGILGCIFSLRGWLERVEDCNKFILFVFNVTGWSYFVVMWIWRWHYPYYIYPVAVLFVISLFGSLDSNMLTSIIKWGRISKILICSVVTVILLYQLNWMYISITAQADSDKVFSQALCSMEKLEDDANVYMEDYYYFQQEPNEIRLYFSYINPKPIDITGIKQVIQEDVSAKDWSVYGVSEEKLEKAKSIVPKVGDYVLLLTGHRDNTVRVRAVTPLHVDHNPYLSEMGYKLELVDANRITRKVPAVSHEGVCIDQWFCGYKLYKVIACSDEA